MSNTDITITQVEIEQLTARIRARSKGWREDQARLLEASQPLVRRLSLSWHVPSLISREDCQQEAWIAVLRCSYLWQPGKASWATYITSAIVNRWINVLSGYRTVSCPTAAAILSTKVQQAAKDNPEFTEQQIATSLNASFRRVSNARVLNKQSIIPLVGERDLTGKISDPLSLSPSVHVEDQDYLEHRRAFVMRRVKTREEMLALKKFLRGQRLTLREQDLMQLIKKRVRAYARR